jgi:hypothetical protein
MNYLSNKVIIVAGLLLLAACGKSDPLDQFAGTFLGGSLSAFGGDDGSDPQARDTADDMAQQRSFDFTPTGFVIESGTIASQPEAGSAFGVGSGSLDVNGDNATVDLDLVSNDPNVSGARMRGQFSLEDASAALINPQSSFDVQWEIDFSYLGVPISLNATQRLTGQDFETI